ncbi:MAG: PASTA domain-containing protein [Acidobacteria bacterium]|nr:PASTA domain-containing protein [Acidobacteriota bacterium]
MASELPSSLQEKFLTLGKFLLLTGILVAVALLSAFVAMRMAVRGTEVKVPSVLEKPVEEARNVLKKSGLGLEVTVERYDDKIPQGAIVTQHPGAGVHMKANRKVQVIMSLGRRQNPVPELRGSSLRAARLMVMQYGYEVGSIAEMQFEKPAGEVIQQFPLPDSKSPASRKIDILVARNPTVQYVMPELVGQDLNRVLPFLQQKGLKVGKIQYRAYQNIAKGTVVRQFPEPGHPLEEKKEINLEVAR